MLQTQTIDQSHHTDTKNQSMNILWCFRLQVKPHTYCKAPGKKKLLITCGICSKTCIILDTILNNIKQLDQSETRLIKINTTPRSNLRYGKMLAKVGYIIM